MTDGSVQDRYIWDTPGRVCQYLCHRGQAAAGPIQQYPGSQTGTQTRIRRHHFWSGIIQQEESKTDKEEAGLDDKPVEVQASLSRGQNLGGPCWPPAWGRPPLRPAPPPHLHLSPLILWERKQSDLNITFISSKSLSPSTYNFLYSFCSFNWDKSEVTEASPTGRDGPSNRKIMMGGFSDYLWKDRILK